MALPIHMFNSSLISAGDLSGNITGTGINIDEVVCFAVQMVWSAGSSPVGTLTVEGSNDNVTYTSVGSTVSVSGNTGSGLVNVSNAGYSWVRVTYARTSGSGTLNASINAKRN